MGDRDLIVRVAAAQASPVWMNREASLEKAIALIDKAGAQGANLIAFGESWLPGFPFWIWLGTPRWGSDYFVRLHQNSVEADGTEISAIGDAARRNNIEVVMGATERDGGSLYCTQFFISSSGSLRGRHRKLKPTHVERTIWGEGDGSDLIVLDTPVGRVGGLNCWEHLQPLSKYAMYSQGEQIHVAAWPALSIYEDDAYALGVEANMAASRTYALEGQGFVLAVTSVVDDSVIEELCTTEEQRRLLKRGGGTTTIFGPNGATIAGPLGADEEGLLIADLDLSEIRRAKQAADPTGHYARADATRLLLNPQPRNPVERDQSKATEFVTTEELSVPAPNEFDS
ncbi:MULTISPECIES: carbon-nitrogen hydrolase family protein [unclassified Mycolicibacterium]|uniref:carbon-nitrogen hydrolase family protein n=1 Tax=unclassified Mycolicibacterium TaxID=2636767 RepID=UPI0012DF6929|nr:MULTISPECIES: carbon-nitrogen hydrolase family protein [unclassified Mycolicibacterium]MUL81305.1 carbon-nitrogen hydrolase family protein [Mycolicibacterium sp. CBMA 329]MUL87071.1 carbon-nitrogen hydrolase family protein [Mycolicibacterium sp. CBMA 331]MUL98647.1 carbon-nitrogen hydrolase family protein [Mycolicibacterium sp. CBMA 334]MUM37368.1 carbon-nitrogen hydrolase family protein [Mycolicibacterium sp. CBMA 247]MUM43136.1 carbon-nitrogen hydrolase family protein [Mycolicibacterium s